MVNHHCLNYRIVRIVYSIIFFNIEVQVIGFEIFNDYYLIIFLYVIAIIEIRIVAQFFIY